MRLSEHFTLSEMTKTDTEYPNQPDNPEHLVNITRLVCTILEPLRKSSGRIFVNSGYRSELVNEVIGGSPKSYHLSGLAADIRSESCDVHDLVRLCNILALPYDKLIMEYSNDVSWLHVQIAPAGKTNRGYIYEAHERNGGMIYKKIN